MGLGGLRKYRITLVVLATSVLTHATIAFLLLRIPSHVTASSPTYEIELSVDERGGGAPTATGEDGERALHNLHERLVLGGPTSAQNVDDFERGQGGDGVGVTDAVRLASQADDITLQDSPMTTVGVAQAQRIRTANDRATEESRRATPNPSNTPFLASGHGEHRERRRVAEVDPREGAPRATPAALAGAASLRRSSNSLATDQHVDGMIVFVGAADASHMQPQNSPTAAVSGTTADGSEMRVGDARSSVGRGIQDGRTERESDAARVANGRPPVDQAHAATQTPWRSGEVRDNQDAELLAARMLQSMVDSSQRSGARAGVGNGGVGGGGAAGVGGGGEAGGRAHSYAPGAGHAGALDTHDSRYRMWMLELQGRVAQALSFPRARQLAMDEGQSVFHVFVRRDGTLAQAPRLVRSSHFDDLDNAASAAIQHSAPFSPVPADVASGVDVLRITVPVNFSNPMVQ